MPTSLHIRLPQEIPLSHYAIGHHFSDFRVTPDLTLSGTIVGQRYISPELARFHGFSGWVYTIERDQHDLTEDSEILLSEQVLDNAIDLPY